MRPSGLPNIDARTLESKESAKYLILSCDPSDSLRMVDTPTKQMQQNVKEGIRRQLKLRFDRKK